MNKLYYIFSSTFKLQNFCRYIFLVLLYILVLFAGEPLYIAYTANLNGNIELCRCKPDEMGSIAQLSGMIDLLKTDYPELLLLDNGDFYKTYPKPIANFMAGELISLLNYDAVGVGDQEFVEGISFLDNMWHHFPITLLNANIKIMQPTALLFKRYLVVTKANYKVGITSILPPAAFEFIAQPNIQILPVEETLSKILDDLIPQCDIIILIYHSGYLEALNIAQKFPHIKVIIAGHSQEQAVKRRPGQIIVQPGFDGEYLGFLKLSREGERFVFDHTFLPIGESLNPTPLFLEKLQQYHNKLKVKK